jgi:transcriptional antiterminator RfaH
MPSFWYVLHSCPYKEEMLWHSLLSKGVEVFYPRVRVKPVNPRSRSILPYFPGYMFVQCDLEVVGKNFFEWMPGARGLVKFDGIPAILEDSFVAALRKRIGEIVEKKGEGLKSGDVVTIQKGPFEGYEAIFDTRLSGSDRVRVLLLLLDQRSIAVELAGDSVKKKDAPQNFVPLWRG